MKKAIHIFIFACLALYGTAVFAQNATGSYIVFQPDNRTTNLSAEDVNTIWQDIEKIAAASGNIMSRHDFTELTASLGLQSTGSNLRNEQELRGRLAQIPSYKNLIFTRITRWGKHFNVSMEKVALPGFTMTRASLPLSAKITTIEQLLDKLPGLMKELGFSEKVLQPLSKPFVLVMPPTADKPLQTFCTALQKHLSEGGVKSSIQADGTATSDAVMAYVVFDKYENQSQTLDLPMQKRQLLKTSISLSGKLSMESNGTKTDFSFSRSDSRTGKPEAGQPVENEFLDLVAHDTAKQIIQKLNATQASP